MEYQRTLYLHCVHGRGDIVESEPAWLRARGRRAGPGATLLQALYRVYYRQQRFYLGSTARLERNIARWRVRNPRLLPELAGRYERSHRRLLPAWALMASNSHKAGIVVAAFIPVAGTSFWGGLGMGWYLVYVLALNAALAVLLPAQRAGRPGARAPSSTPSTGADRAVSPAAPAPDGGSSRAQIVGEARIG